VWPQAWPERRFALLLVGVTLKVTISFMPLSDLLVMCDHHFGSSKHSNYLIDHVFININELQMLWLCTAPHKHYITSTGLSVFCFLRMCIPMVTRELCLLLPLVFLLVKLSNNFLTNLYFTWKFDWAFFGKFDLGFIRSI
jgi:hypothetical protein